MAITPLVFFGTDDFSDTVLTALLSANIPVTLVVTKPDSPSGRGQKLNVPAVKKTAEAHGIRVLQPERLIDIEAELRTLRPVAGVLASYGRIVPKSILDIFSPGIINVHPSLLPHYRGATPIESAILDGVTVTGVTIMQLVPEMDAGPIYAQAELPLSGNETAPELYKMLAQKGAELLIRVLPQILDGSLLGQPQDPTKATFTHLLKKEDGMLNPLALTAAEAERQVRAYLIYPRTRIEVFGYNLIITRAHAAAEPKTALDPRCLDGNYLVIDELIAPSGKTMTAEAFLNGYAA